MAQKNTMALDPITLEGAIKAATPIAKKIFHSKISPFVSKKVGEYFESKAALDKFEKKTKDYLAKLVGKCSTLSTIAFSNVPKRIEDLYIPLTLNCGGEDSHFKVDEKTNVFHESNHVLVTDAAGMGKSTLSKRVILNVVAQGEYVPVFLELRELDDRPIYVQIVERFGIKSDFPKEFLKKIPLLYVFDGLDEVSADIQKKVVRSLNEFSNYFDDSKILITSRRENYLSQFVDFKRYSIRPLNKEEAYLLIRKYDPSGDFSEKLVDGIENSNDGGLKEFLSTPLYVSLLYCSYRYKTVVPQKKHLFYSQVYDALFESHDLSKDVGYVRPKHSKLDSAEFHRVLRRLGFWCLRNNGKIEFQKDEFEILLGNIIEKISGVDVSASSYSRDLVSTVPLFVKEGATVRWSHKSLMEYFASMFICNDAKIKQNDILLHLYNDRKWSAYQNVFELCADIDYGSFRASIIKAVLEKFSDYSNSAYKEIKNKRISKKLIDERISLTFSLEAEFLFSKRNRNKKLEEYIRNFEDENWEYYSSSMRFFSEAEGDFLFCSKMKREKVILNILREKSPFLFLKKREIEFKLIVKNFSKSSIRKCGICIVNDDPKNIANNSVNFELVNDVLWLDSDGALDRGKVDGELEKILHDSSDGVASLLDGMF